MAYLKPAKDEDEVKKTPVAQLRKDYNKLASDYNKMISGRYSYCHKCNTYKNEESFYHDENYKSGLFPMCKTCIMCLVEQRDIGPKGKNQEPHETKESVQKVLKMMDRVYDEAFYEQCIKGAKDKMKEKNRSSPFATYITAISSLPNWKGMTWDDSTFSAEYYNNELNEDSQSSQRLIKKGRKRFGDYPPKELLRLEREYEDWIQRYPCDSKAQEALFETLVCQRLEAEKARKANKPTKDLDRSVQDTMTALGIKPSQTDANALTDTLTLGQLIAKFEEERPIPEPDDDFKDVDHIGTYIDVFFKGHLAKMMGLKNAFSNLYEKYISKLRVERPDLSEEDDEALFNQIFDTELGGG